MSSSSGIHPISVHNVQLNVLIVPRGMFNVSLGLGVKQCCEGNKTANSQAAFKCTHSLLLSARSILFSHSSSILCRQLFASHSFLWLFPKAQCQPLSKLLTSRLHNLASEWHFRASRSKTQSCMTAYRVWHDTPIFQASCVSPEKSVAIAPLSGNPSRNLGP